MKSTTLVGIAALALLTSGCSAGTTSVDAASDFPDGSTMAEIAASGKIKIGAEPGQPGLSELDLGGDWEGFNIDLAKYLVAPLGIEDGDIEWVNTTAANRIPFIEQGKIDLLATALAMTPEREKVIAIAGPYLATSPQLITRKGDAADLKTLADIPQGTKICVLQGSQGQPRVSAVTRRRPIRLLSTRGNSARIGKANTVTIRQISPSNKNPRCSRMVSCKARRPACRRATSLK